MIGAKLGQYEVVAKLGEGGMGEVYRARDPLLNRDVAIKVLPPGLQNDAERTARFRREAQVLASLNHPNIAQIYEAGSGFLAMELVPGPTLAELIDRNGAVPPDEVVEIARQIAEGLEAAHEAGIIHRDLKPANVKRRDDGVVKVLDFGLARAVESAGPSEGDTASSPTMLSPAATQRGVILGTAGYMSPEQARGRVVDKRADIWAFGVVLFEMLTGQRLFKGETVTEVIASVIKDAPRLEALPAATPPALRLVVTRCLERDPKARLRDIGEARILLSRADQPLPGSSGRVSAGAMTPRAGRPWFGWVAGAVALAGVTAAIAWSVKPTGTVTPLRRFDLPIALDDSSSMAISPDGSRVAYLSVGHLFVRALAASDPTDIGSVPPATAVLFWSPDSRHIAYGSEGTIRVVKAEGGAPFTVCKLPPRGRLLDGLWAEDGTIYYAVWRDSIYRVPATGGSPELHIAINPANEVDFHSLTRTADGRFIVATHERGDDGVKMELFEQGKRTAVADERDAEWVRFSAPDQLLFSRIRSNQGTWVAPFERGRVDLARATLLEANATRFDVSREGTLVSMIPPRQKRQLVWAKVGTATAGAVTTDTRSIESLAGQSFESVTPALAISPDGRRAVVAIRSPDGKEEFLVRDLTSGVDTRIALPQAPTGMSTGARVSWTSNGRLLYASGGVETLQIYEWPADGSGTGRALVAGVAARMTPDGRELLFSRDERSFLRMYRAPIRPDGSVGEPVRLFNSSAEPSVRHFDLSRDGTMVAFTTVDAVTGQLNVVIATYPDLSERQQVTADGGSRPRFSPSGREVYFVSGTRDPGSGQTRGRLQVASIARNPLAAATPRTLLVEGPAGMEGVSIAGFDVAADGRILLTQPIPAAPGNEARTVLLQNWHAAVRKH